MQSLAKKVDSEPVKGRPSKESQHQVRRQWETAYGMR
jgi:hypothetical protein